MNSFQTAEQAWRSLVKSVLEDGNDVQGVSDPLSVGSAFGQAPRATRELVAVGMGIDNARARLFCSDTKRFRLGFAIAQVIWAFSGSDRVEPLAYYQPRGLSFSDDGASVRSAFGRRVFRSAQGDQLHEAINKIKEDPSTRRALVQIYHPDDLFVPTKDVSCVGSLHFLPRGGKLHAVAHMRSQSTFTVLPYDLFLLTMFHEFAAVKTSLKLGTFSHMCNSAHIYEDEFANAANLTAEPMHLAGQMPPMPSSAGAELPFVIAAEAEIRSSFGTADMKDIDAITKSLPPYWRDLLQALVVDLRLRRGFSWQESGGELLPIVYQRVLEGAIPATSPAT